MCFVDIIFKIITEKYHYKENMKSSKKKTQTEIAQQTLLIICDDDFLAFGAAVMLKFL